MGPVSILTVLPRTAMCSADILGTLAVSLVLPDLGQRAARGNARDSLHLTAYQALMTREASRDGHDRRTMQEFRPGAA